VLKCRGKIKKKKRGEPNVGRLSMALWARNINIKLKYTIIFVSQFRGVK
jgi:hypothetical protein